MVGVEGTVVALEEGTLGAAVLDGLVLFTHTSFYSSGRLHMLHLDHPQHKNTHTLKIREHT